MSRIILKVSGEALRNENVLVSKEKLKIILDTIKLLKKENHKIGIVVGGGNFFRGRENTDMSKVNADTIGMLGTIMNALYIKDYIEKNSINCAVSTPFSFPNLLNDYNIEELNEAYDNGNVIIFGGGIGQSGYSTDSGAAMAAELLNGDLIVKMTNVDGVYDSDPKMNKDAIKFDKLDFDEIIEKKLKVMDLEALKKCKQNNINILVINFTEYEKIIGYLKGIQVGTIIKNG